jgi:hypothetical protein
MVMRSTLAKFSCTVVVGDTHDLVYVYRFFGRNAFVRNQSQMYVPHRQISVDVDGLMQCFLSRHRTFLL